MTELFAALPADFDQLAHAARAIRATGFGREPDLRNVGERTYAVFAAADFAPLRAAQTPANGGVRQRDWRNLPYALWLGSEGGLHPHDALTGHYLDAQLAQALQTRRPLKWARALLHAYLEHFAPDNALFLQLAEAARRFFAHPRVLEPLGQTEAHGLQRLLRELHLLDPLAGPQQVAQDIVAMPSHLTLDDWQQRHALTAHFWLNPFARAAFAHALQASAEVRRSPHFIERLCDWALHDAGQPTQRMRYPVLRDEFAWALLSPWFEQAPPPALRQQLLDALLRTLGDPRHDHAGWLGVRRQAIETASRWLTERTLDAFFDILRRTDDPIGPWRCRFWEAYFQAGHISEAWIALGEEAAQALAAGDPEGRLPYAQILGRIAPQQSVLMLRMGDILFCDWSHDGRLRAIPARHKQAPKLYQPTYELFELRFPTPLDFNQGRFDDPGLAHTDSAQGGWQSVAREFIGRQLGIDLPLATLLPSDLPATAAAGKAAPAA